MYLAQFMLIFLPTPPNTQHPPSAVFIFAFIALGTFRCVALYQNYHAPMDVYMQLHSLYREKPPLPRHQPVRLCAGKEWYRYPSSFFLPTDQWEFRFVRSEFRAQLPNIYQAPPPAGSKLIPDHMNDQNLEVCIGYTSEDFNYNVNLRFKGSGGKGNPLIKSLAVSYLYKLIIC